MKVDIDFYLLSSTFWKSNIDFYLLLKVEHRLLSSFESRTSTFWQLVPIIINRINSRIEGNGLQLCVVRLARALQLSTRNSRIYHHNRNRRMSWNINGVTSMRILLWSHLFRPLMKWSRQNHCCAFWRWRQQWTWTSRSATSMPSANSSISAPPSDSWESSIERTETYDVVVLPRRRLICASIDTTTRTIVASSHPSKATPRIMMMESRARERQAAAGRRSPYNCPRERTIYVERGCQASVSLWVISLYDFSISYLLFLSLFFSLIQSIFLLLSGVSNGV